MTLAEIGRRVGRKALREIACVAKPDTILAWYRKLIAQKFDGSTHRQYPGRPRLDPKLESLIVRVARDDSTWGYDRIVGALANLGHVVSDQTVGNVLRRHGIAPAPQRSRTMSWRDFLTAHLSVLAGADFFTVEVLKWRGLVTYYVLFFLHLETRRITIAGITRHPDGEWMEQIARTASQESGGYLNQCRLNQGLLDGDIWRHLGTSAAQPALSPETRLELRRFAEPDIFHFEPSVPFGYKISSPASRPPAGLGGP